MDRLPIEIRQMIAKWTGDESKKSLQALSRVNSEWNGIAAAILYHDLIIRLDSNEAHHISPYLLGARRVLTNVRRLSIISGHTSQESYNPWMCLDDVLEQAYLGDEHISNIFLGEQGDWNLVIDLIRRLPHLHKAKILIQNGGPVELLEALSQYHPTCQMTMFTSWIGPASNSFNRGEICTPRLLSPVLHGVNITCFEGRSTDFSEHPDRILQSIILFAPHIRQLALQIARCPGHSSQKNLNERVKLISQPLSDETPAPAKLESLSWPLNTKMTAKQFQDWQRITDFRVLKSWTIGCIEDSMLLQTVVDVQPFRDLMRLTLALFQNENDIKFWPAAELMFKSLPPLRYLCLLGTYSPSFLNGPVLWRHGSTLLELKLHMGCHLWTSRALETLSRKGQIGPLFSSQSISELANHCPSLQKLRICVQRRRGLETDIYAALGRFPCLKELDLVLNCLPEMDINMVPVPHRNLTDFEKGSMTIRWNGCPRWFFRDCMINCAIDETLAEAIFTYISACQKRKSLVQLTIHPLFGQAFQYQQYLPGEGRGVHCKVDDRFLTQLAPTWIVKRGFMTGLHIRAAKSFDPYGNKSSFDDGTMEIFKSIWPKEPDVNTWPLDWHSWALQSE